MGVYWLIITLLCVIVVKGDFLGSLYTIHTNKTLSSSSNFIGFYQMKKLTCLLKCNSISNCSSVNYISSNNNCSLYSSMNNSNWLIGSADSIVFEKINITNVLTSTSISTTAISTTTMTTTTTTTKTTTTSSSSTTTTTTITTTASTYLLNYWPINSNDVKDYIGSANMNCTGNTSFVADRKNNASSALYIASTFCSVPSGIYFYPSDFSVLFWVNLRSYCSNNIVVFDFGCGGADNIAPFIMGGYNGLVQFDLLYNHTASYFNAPTHLSLNTWYHLAFVLKNTTIYYYLNGTLDTSLTNSALPRNILRTSCNFGKTAYSSNYLDAYIDDIKIYNRSLSSTEVIADFNSY